MSEATLTPISANIPMDKNVQPTSILLIEKTLYFI